VKATKKDKDFWLDDEGFSLTEEYHEEIIKQEQAAKKRKQRAKKCILPDGTRCKKKCADCPKGAPTGDALSYDWLVLSGYEVAGPTTTEEIFDGIQELETLKSALASLTEDDCRLVRAMYYEDKTERECGTEMNISPSKVHRKKKAILKRLKAFFEKYQ
jgi:RNA polymerase sigma factor (sigma-70 family)